MINSLTELGMSTIAIVDDVLENAEALSVSVEICGCKPLIFTDNLEDLNSLLEEIMQKANGVLCDNRLGYQTRAAFWGVEAVAGWFDRKFPAILVSEYTDRDSKISIRRLRRKIPFVIPQDMVDKQSIIEGFIVCQQEINDQPPSFRKPRRTIVHIADFGDDYVESFIPQWNPHRAVTFPRSLLGKYDNNEIKIGMLFIADVNIGANSADELFFDNFELAPEPDDNDGLA